MVSHLFPLNINAKLLMQPHWRLLLHSVASQCYIYHELMVGGRSKWHLSSHCQFYQCSQHSFWVQLLKFICINCPSVLCLCFSFRLGPNKWSKAFSFLKLAQISISLSLLHLFSQNPTHTPTSSLSTCSFLPYIMIRDMSDLSLNPHCT